MNKKGYLVWLIVLVIIVGLVIISTLFFPIGALFSNTDSSEINNGSDLNVENPPEAIPKSEEPTISSCSDYLDESSCKSDSENILSNSSEWDHLVCESEGFLCVCSWDSNNSLCEFYSTEVVSENVVDLEAFKLYIQNVNCSGGENATCSVDLVGVIRNIGSVDVTDEFFSGFTHEGNLVKLIKVTTDILVGEEYNVTYEYSNLSFGDLSIQFAVDTSARIAESDESNNLASNLVGLP